MPKLSEEDVKTQVGDKFFPSSRYIIQKGHVDFMVSDKAGMPLFWAEAKKGQHDFWSMFTQLLLTIKPHIRKEEKVPLFLGCFDEENIVFVEYHDVLKVFNTNDFNWNEKPSSVSKASENRLKVIKIIDNKIYKFEWHKDTDEIKKFISEKLKYGDIGLFDCEEGFFPINKNNFVVIFDKWIRMVFPSINIPTEITKEGVIAKDFYLADLMSFKNETIFKKLKIILNRKNYEVNIRNKIFQKIEFNDKGTAHKAFWKKYIRPP